MLQGYSVYTIGVTIHHPSSVSCIALLREAVGLQPTIGYRARLTLIILTSAGSRPSITRGASYGYHATLLYKEQKLM